MYYVSMKSKLFVGLSIVVAAQNQVARGGKRNDAAKSEIHGSTARELVKRLWVTKILGSKNTFYHLTDLGRSVYKAVAES